MDSEKLDSLVHTYSKHTLSETIKPSHTKSRPSKLTSVPLGFVKSNGFGEEEC